MFFVLPETKGVPLEEMAAKFGDKEDVMVYLQDVQIDAKTHKLMLEGENHIAREATVDDYSDKDVNEHVEVSSRV
jgi:hypothetical protein